MHDVLAVILRFVFTFSQFGLGIKLSDAGYLVTTNPPTVLVGS